MATPFASVTDLTDRGLAVADENQANVFLQDASDLLRSEIGWQVYPPAAVTVTAQPDSYGHITLPGAPISEVTSVVYGGTTLTGDDYTLHNGVLHVVACGLVTVTYVVGYVAPPPDLVSWTCVLAAQMLARSAMADGGLGATPASIAVDDVRVNFSAQQQAGTWGIPERALERLRSAFGATAFVTS
jgi:hypothetical protein